MLFYLIVFFNTKPAYEMRISYCSSVVCSSDREYRFAEVVGQDAAVGAEERRRAGPLLCPPPLRAERTDVTVGDVESDHARAGVDAGAAERAKIGRAHV